MRTATNKKWLESHFFSALIRPDTKSNTLILQARSNDYIGAALLVLGSVPLLLGFTWAGTQYDWLSPQIIGLFAWSLLTLTGFMIYEARLERLGGQPIIEPGLFKNSIFGVSTIISVIFGMGLFGSIFFIPLFVQGVVIFYLSRCCYIPLERSLKTLIAT